MAIQRFKAIEHAQNRPNITIEPGNEKISDFFGLHVFDDSKMRATLSSDIYERLQLAILKGTVIEPDVADSVAAAMKSWALGKGVTHYTHWFQPLTGTTAERHDAFFDLDHARGEFIEKFKGNELAQQEPDASSFPSGGLRSTFEARGYTAWDASSPAFIMEIEGSKTLCIPTIFVSYTGEALDYKAPLLKTLHFLDKAACDVCEIFDKDVKKVYATLGAEQEYFLIDKALYNARPDLVMCGRTVFGHTPAKGQQLGDHYFGSIPPRVRAFMVDFEREAIKLGIPVRTRHNEVAPSQYESASAFEEVNLAVDHNALLMDIMEKVAEKHKFKALFHEKPFAEINGSGKHNNWSLATDNGRNLLGLTTKAKENLQFLTFFVIVIKAVHDYADLLRASIASAGNDFRLGANEAPPAIISVYIGSELQAALDELDKKSTFKFQKGDNIYMKLGISKLPPIILDNTDRNRTSPFAFTGNKFEFRAVGSAANCAAPMIVLNTIVAEQLTEFKKAYDIISQNYEKKEVAVIEILRDYIKSSRNILFEGDNYSEEWIKEAEKRGLSNIKSTPKALDAYLSKKSIQLFTKNEIFTERELRARIENRLDDYIKRIQIESRTIGDLALNHILPIAINYQNKLIQNVKGLRELNLDVESMDSMIDSIKTISHHISQIQKLCEDMRLARRDANQIMDNRERAIVYEEKVKSYFELIRYHIDKLELIIDDEDWPLPKYRELLMIR
ncbi:MAG: glutamine synthetase III [Microscillaceae bacterium]|nr:glutamine synthetase III [Microscillaceae bacterium]